MSTICRSRSRHRFSAHQPWQCLLSRTRPTPEADLAIMPTSRPAASGISFRRLRMLQGLLVPRGEDRPSSRQDADAADGVEALIAVRARQAEPGQIDPISAARCSDHATEPRFGVTSPISRWRAASSIWPLCVDWVSRSRAVVAPIDHDGGGVLRRDAEDALAATASRKSSTLIRGSQFTGAAFMACDQKRDADRAWTARRLARQHLRRAAVAQHQIEEVYLRGYASVSEAALRSANDFYNGGPPSFDEHDQAYFTPLPLRLAA